MRNDAQLPRRSSSCGVAQLVERRIVNPVVVGSSPTATARSSLVSAVPASVLFRAFFAVVGVFIAVNCEAFMLGYSLFAADAVHVRHGMSDRARLQVFALKVGMGFRVIESHRRRLGAAVQAFHSNVGGVQTEPGAGDRDDREAAFGTVRSWPGFSHQGRHPHLRDQPESSRGS